MITIDPTNVQILVGLVLPVLVGLVPSTWNSKVKTIIGAAVSGVAALVVNAVNDAGVAVLTWEMLSNWGLGFAVQVAAYTGFYKNLDLNEKLPDAPVQVMRFEDPEKVYLKGAA